MSDKESPIKPIGRKAYGHIPHLPGSRMGPGDHRIHRGQATIATLKVRDRHDEVIVQEKLDGSNVSVALESGAIIPLQRKGYAAISSPYEQHRLFAAWVFENEHRFRAVLAEGDRLCGEWLAQAHGTRYALPHEPFVAFDLMRGAVRAPFDTSLRSFMAVADMGGFVVPRLIHRGGAFAIGHALEEIRVSGHGAIDPVEGAVWRVERRGVFDFICKYVRPDKKDGRYLPGCDGSESSVEVWNWRPQ